MRYHDFHLGGYSVSEYGSKITLHLVWSYKGQKEKDSHIEFSEVVCYHFSHTESAILTDLEEEPLDIWLKQEAEFLAKAAEQDGLRFWAGNPEQYMARLKNEGYKSWRIESAIGFSGFVVAKQVAQLE